MNPKPYVYGDPLTPEEFSQVRARMLPYMSRKGRGLPLGVLLTAFYAMLPNRLEHEVNRIRGWAFDSGEHGFSHAVITGGPS